MKTKLSIVLSLALLLLVFAGCQSANPQLQEPNAPAAGQENPVEQNPAPNPEQADPTTAPKVVKELTAEEAKELALQHAGLNAADVTRLSVEYDRDDGLAHYDIDFQYGDYDYDYEVDAKTGKILKNEKEYDPVKQPAASTQESQQPTTTKPSVKLTKADAKQIALEHAGLKESEVTHLQVELDRDDGVYLYEVEFKKGGFEYSYEIHADSGKILDADKEWDD